MRPAPHAATGAAPDGLLQADGCSLLPISFEQIDGWFEDDLGAALHAFRAGAKSMLDHPPKTRGFGVDGVALARIAHEALALPPYPDLATARGFFETYFRPHRISAEGFVTAYYEPEVAASRLPAIGFPVPLYRRPGDLVEVAEASRPDNWNPEVRFARYGDAGLEPYFDRAAIEEGALRGRGLELAWLADPVDAFFIHVQGSARLKLVEGGTLRVGFDGKSGHAYTSLGHLAVERGLLTRDAAHKAGLEAWLKARPEEARSLMRENRSFIFFRETSPADGEGPIGAAGVPLAAGRSLAVDRHTMTFHTPVWVEARELADPDRGHQPFQRLMVAQDTGSAIVGPARGDLFFGSGEEAGSKAGRVRHAATMIILVPIAAPGAAS
jgi:membrane-bound lytic murein transglycosylase A